MVPTSFDDKDWAGLGPGMSLGGLLIQRMVPERAIMGLGQDRGTILCSPILVINT